MFPRYVLPCFLLLSSGCTVYHVTDYQYPPVEVPETFLNEEPGVGNISQWWREFDQPGLNLLMPQALVDNMDIQQAWARLSQAQANQCIVSSKLYPEVNLSFGSSFNNAIDRDENSSFMLYFLKPTLSYEIDLWKKIDSSVKAAKLQTSVSWEEVEATALVLSGAVTDAWFIIQEQKSLIDLIKHQIAVSEMMLEVVELRFSIGEASALDVYQQRLQLEEVVAQIIPVENRLKTASYELSVLLGTPPEAGFYPEPTLERIDLPLFPDLGTPTGLLCRRPDLRAAYFAVEAADYNVAAAVADLFPRLTLDSSYLFAAQNIQNIFRDQLGVIAANVFQPVFDGYRRSCEVKKREAIVCELLSKFGSLFLKALREVEDAIVTEKSQLRLIAQIDKEIEIAKLYLDEAQLRYSHGLNDYLQVITAIQSLQGLERRRIREHTILLTNRSKLYRALAGPCLLRCEEREETP